MKYNTFGVVASVVAGTVVLVATACTGDDPVETPPDVMDAGTSSSSSGTATTTSGAPAPTPQCAVDADCVPKLPSTTPPDCAAATCDPATKKCVFKAKDSDKDGHTAKTCSAGAVPIVTGDDCDDADPNMYPGAWDGPASEMDSGANVHADRCDQRDNDCNGSPDDGKIAVDGGDKTCSCDPSAPLPCYEFENGTPISGATLDADNKPKGACKKGLRTCTNGVPGKCIGAVGPADEQCDDLDHDCDGMSGNGGDGVIGAPTWYKDSDGDSAGDQNTTPKMQCSAPAADWKQSIPNNDCDDGDAQRNPALGEVCDGKDNNCNGVNDDGFNINGGCTAGTNGVCKRNGTTQCAGASSTTCSPGAGTANDTYHYAASTDPLIVTTNNNVNYSAAWDWNCNGNIEAYPEGAPVYNWASGSAISYLCSTANYQAACTAMSSSSGTCHPVAYACGNSFTPAQACGATVTVSYCLWSGTSCDTYDSGAKTMICK